MTLLILISALFAHAGGMHTGIPVHGVEGLGDPAFQTVTTGWTAPVEGGFVRVFVGTTEQDAVNWTARMRESLSRYKPLPNNEYLESSEADEAYGDGIGLIIFRDGNIGCMVRHKEDALPWAQVLHASISDNGSSWPAPPSLKRVGDHWQVESAPNTAHISFQGGKMALSPSLAFREKPHTLVRWDEWGRSATQTYEQGGAN